MEALGLDIRFLIAQLVNFGVFAFVFVKFLHKPFMAYLADQRKEEDEKVRLLEDLHKQEESLLEKEKAVLDEAHKQAEALLKEARTEAEEAVQKIRADAQEEVLELKRRGQKELAESQSRMHDEIRAKALSTAQTLTAEVLKHKLTEEHHKDIIKHVTQSLKESAVYEN